MLLFFFSYNRIIFRYFFCFSIRSNNRYRGNNLILRKIDYLELEEVEALLELPDQTPKGLRDRAIMELMYGTGIRVSELVRLKYSDLNLRMRFLSCRDANDNSRVIPIGSYAYSALKDYMEKAYGTFVDKEIEAEDSLFVNMHGKCITRQGVIGEREVDVEDVLPLMTDDGV